MAYFLKRYGFPKFTALASTVIVAAFMITQGLRPDTLGIAFLSVGTLLLTKDTPLMYFLGFSFLGAAVITQPATLAYALPFGIGISTVNFHYNQVRKVRYTRSRVFSLIASLSLVVILFLLCIRFEIGLFIMQFKFNLESATPKTFQEKISWFVALLFRDYGYILYLPSWLLLLFLALVSIWKRKGALFEYKVLFLAMFMGLAFNILLHVRREFILLFCWLFITAIISKMIYNKKILSKSRNKALLLSATWLFPFLLRQSLSITSLVGGESVPTTYYSEIRKRALAQSNKQYIVDQVAARFVFDYRLPENTTSWVYYTDASGLTQGPAAPEKLKGKFLYIASPSRNYPRVELFGKKFNSLRKKPFNVTILEN